MNSNNMDQPVSPGATIDGGGNIIGDNNISAGRDIIINLYWPITPETLHALFAALNEEVAHEQ